MGQEPTTFKIADLPSTYSQSIIDVLQTFTDRYGPQDSESIQLAQLSSSMASMNISGTPGSQSSPRIEFSGTSHTDQPDYSRSAQALNLARALIAKLQRHLRKQAAALRQEATDESTVPLDKLPGHSLRIRSLALKPDRKQKARERGAREVEGNFLTLEMTQQLINLAYRHVSHNTERGLRLVTEIILLRLSAVLRAENERVCLLTDCPIRAVNIPGEDPNCTFGGVVDYVLTKYSASPEFHGSGTSTFTGQAEDVAAAPPPTFQKLGSANIFHVSSVAELTHGLPHYVLAAASWSRQSRGQQAMRAVVTTGEHWIFFAYKRSASARSGESCYARSGLFSVRAAEDILYVDWILGVLLDWIENTGNCDTFAYFEDPQYE